MQPKELGKKKAVSKSKRKQALLGVIGVWKNRTDLLDTDTYISSLRKGTRLPRLT